MILVDALRADHLTAERMPNLTRRAQGGVRGELRSPETHCLRAVGSLLMGVPTERLRRVRSRALGEEPVIPRLAWTLPEILQCEGLRTAGFSANGYTSEPFGVTQGFEQFHNALRAYAGTTAPAVLSVAESWIAAQQEERWFVYVHLMEPHVPYDPPAEFAPARPEGAVAPDATAGWVQAVQRGQRSATPADAAWIASLYAAEVRTVDRALDQFMDRLERRGALRDTLVVIVADHGELLGTAEEGGRFGHSEVAPSVSQVPFVALGPGRPHVVPTDATLANVAPTILEALGIALPDRIEAASFGPDALRPPVAATPPDYTTDSTRLSREVCERLMRLGYVVAPLDCRVYPTEQELLRARGQGPDAPCDLHANRHAQE
ncbi:MAG: sulfatase-like hydrolase/transferase [Polyangiales bacterium]|nr:sulfatase-like hydrolase/transferase [Sandaracinaceae bacterium]